MRREQMRCLIHFEGEGALAEMETIDPLPRAMTEGHGNECTH
jgi:hypothetical protein